MRAVVFGAGGYIGSHVHEQLMIAGHEAIGVYRTPRGPHEYAADVTDYDAVVDVLNDIRPDTVINCAGSPGSHHGEQAPFQLATSNIIEAAHKVGGRLMGNVVIVGSAAVYGEPQSLPVPETAAEQANNDYAAAKIGEEAAVGELRQEYGMDIAVARIFNPVGSRMPAQHIIPQTAARIAAYAEAQTGELTIGVGQLHARRDYLAATDTARAITTLATAPELDHVAYNVGSGRQTSNRELVQTMLDWCGLELEATAIAPQPQPAYEDLPAYASQADISRLEQLGWHPSDSLLTAVAACIADQRQGREALAA